MNTPAMPTLFVGHGNPMNAIEDSAYSMEWEALGRTLPVPKAILCISAHWETHGTQITAMESPRTIHDFYGFPKELFMVEYPAPGSSALVDRVRELLGEDTVSPDTKWGLDHGAWSVLRRMYPEARIPVVQLSIDRDKSAAEHFNLGVRLRPLRNEGVLILGSGNIVHNLRLMDYNGDPYPWAEEFDAAIAKAFLFNDIQSAIAYHDFGDIAQLSVPTPEHYLPMLYIFGLKEDQEPVMFPVEGIDLASVSMRSILVGG